MDLENEKASFQERKKLIDTVSASVSVRSIVATRGAGRLLALATLEILIEGVAITLRGVRLVRGAGETVTVELPTVRDEQGRITPVLDLHSELAVAIDLAVRREVVETVAERAAGAALSKNALP